MQRAALAKPTNAEHDCRLWVLLESSDVYCNRWQRKRHNLFSRDALSSGGKK
jgi:hypothetical protein